MLEISIRDLIYVGVMLVTVALSYGKLRSEVRHLEDVKAERRELDQLSKEIRGMISEVRMDIARLAETVTYANRHVERRSHGEG